MKAVRQLNPRAVLIENVRGLDRGRHKAYLGYLLRQLKHLDVAQRNGEDWADHDKRLRQLDSDKCTSASYRVKWGGPKCGRLWCLSEPP